MTVAQQQRIGELYSTVESVVELLEMHSEINDVQGYNTRALLKRVKQNETRDEDH